MKKTILAAALGCVCASVAAADWVRLNTTNILGSDYIDRESIRKSGGKIRYVALFDRKKPAAIMGHLSLVTERVLDCDQKNVTTLRQAAYSANMGQGNLLEEEFLPGAPGELAASPVAQRVFQEFCLDGR